MRLDFAKYEGLGNDFIVVDAADERAVDAELARRACDRHFGIGADGILTVLPARTERRARKDARAQCRRQPAGDVRQRRALRRAAPGAHATARTGQATSSTPTRPVAVRGRTRRRRGLGADQHGSAEPWVSTGWNSAAKSLLFTRISMGNPHAVAFDADLTLEAIDRLGPLVSGAFPGGANVEFAQNARPRAFDLVVWERGVGRTLACGTGAAATVVAAALSGRAPFAEPVEVHLPGGALEISVTRRRSGAPARPGAPGFHRGAPVTVAGAEVVTGPSLHVIAVLADATTIELMARTLEHSGDELGVATDLAEGLASTAAEAPDVVLIDVTMGNKAGLAVIHHVRAVAPGTAVYALAPPEALELATQAVALGGSGVILMPLSGDELLTALADVRTRRAEREQRVKLEREAAASRRGATLVVRVAEIAEAKSRRDAAERLAGGSGERRRRQDSARLPACRRGIAPADARGHASAAPTERRVSATKWSSWAGPGRTGSRWCGWRCARSTADFC